MSNVNSDIFVLRLANTSNSDSFDMLTVASDNNEWTTLIPADIVSKGKCFIRVISGLMGLEYNGENAKRIVPNTATAVYWKSNIPFLGFDIETKGAGSAILASARLPIGDDEIVTINSIESRTFTCPRLPSRISIKKLFSDGSATNLDGLLKPANLYTTYIIPAEIVLEITFDEDMSVITQREMNSIRN